MAMEEKQDATKEVLIIEDEPHIQEILKAKSGKDGILFSFADNGEEGLRILREHGSYAAILLDIRMPGSDGMWFLEERRKEPELMKTPVIIFTNLSKQDFIERALKLGVTGYLIKANHGIQQIIEELHKCIDKKICTIDRY